MLIEENKSQVEQEAEIILRKVYQTEFHVMWISEAPSMECQF